MSYRGASSFRISIVTTSALALAIGTGACSSDDGPSTASASEIRGEFSDTRCDGLPRLQGITTPPGVCAGIVQTDIRLARGMAQLDGTAGDLRLVVTNLSQDEAHDWHPDVGGIWLVTERSDGHFDKRMLLSEVDRPHGIAVVGTPGNRSLYIATPHTLFKVKAKGLIADVESRGAPRSLKADAGWLAQNVEFEPLADLPQGGMHVLTTLAYDAPKKTIYLNKGSATDSCEGADPCAEGDVRGLVYAYNVETRQKQIFAKGLRNSVALAIHPESGLLLEADNARNDIDKAPWRGPKLTDYDDPSFPHDELNVVEAGRHYGWPYCFDDNLVSPEYSGTSHASGLTCNSGYSPPALLLAAHSAPVGMAFYPKGQTLFPQAYRGNLIVAMHGARETGHKIAMVPSDASGRPTGPALDIVNRWGGEHPGRPVSIVPGTDGAIYVSEDWNHRVIRLAYDPTTGDGVPYESVDDIQGEDPAAIEARRLDLATRPATSGTFTAIQTRIVDPRCVNCHANTTAGVKLLPYDDRGNAQRMQSLVVAGTPDASRFYQTLATGKMPGGGARLTEDDLALVRAWIEAGAPVP